jgi:hypothetical protein
MLSKDRPFIQQFIQEIPNFKSWVNGYLNDSLDILVNHTEMHLFWFLVAKVVVGDVIQSICYLCFVEP